VRGLMAIPPEAKEPEESREWFRALRKLGERHGGGELSMGMSGDFEVAIEEGATMVRVGTAIFGPRPARPAPGPGGRWRSKASPVGLLAVETWARRSSTGAAGC